LLHTFEKLAVFAICFFYASDLSWSKPGCLLVVDIVRQELVSPSEFQVELVSTLGDRVQSIALKGYHLEICDYDFGEYHLNIRAVGCFEITLLGIGKRYPSEESYRVPIPSCPASQAHGTAGTADGCIVHIRIQNSQSTAVPQAVVRVGDQAYSSADEYGRISILLPNSGDVLDVQVTATGYRRTTERMRCESRLRFAASYKRIWLNAN